MDGSKSWNFKRLSGNGLKLIAIFTMVMDHVGAAVIEQIKTINPALSSEAQMMWWKIDIVLRLIGRLAFPIFCFLIVEGFLHTRNVKKYVIRLLVFSLISEIPFDLAMFNTWFYPEYQNVYVTLVLGLLALIGISKYHTSTWKQALVVLAACGSAALLHTDYGAFGVIFIVLLYLLRYDQKNQTILGCISICWEVTAPLSFIPIRMYNGSRGKWNLKYFFYAFYPVHLLMLWGIRIWLTG